MRRCLPFLVCFSLTAPPVAAAPFLFASRPGDGVVSVFDLATGSHVGDRSFGGVPAGLAMDPAGTRLLVVDAVGGRLVVVDAVTGAGTTLAVGGSPAGVAVNPAGTRAWVANSGDDTVSVVDLATPAVIATVPVGRQPLAVAADGAHVYVTCFQDDSVAVLDASTHALLATVPVGGFPDGVAVAPDGSRAFVTNLFDGTVSILDAGALAVVATLAVGEHPRGVAVAPDGSRVYVANTTSATLSVFDATAGAGATVTTVALAAASPVDLLLSPAGDRVLVSHLESASLSVVETPSLGLGAPIAGPAGQMVLAGFGGSSLASVVSVPTLGAWTLGGFAILLLALGLRHRRVAAGLLVLGALGAGAARAQPVDFFDDTFAPGDWEVFASEVDLGSQAAVQSATGGNPGAYRSMFHHSPGITPPAVETVEVLHRFIGPVSVYFPATQGAIASLELSADVLLGEPDAAVPTIVEGFVVFQGGIAYRGAERTLAADGWQPVSQTGLTATDFTSSGGGTPDFTATGGAITFGTLRRSINNALSGADYAHGIDNFRVEVSRSACEGVDAGVVRLERSAYVSIGGDPVDFTLLREGGTEGAVEAEVTFSPTGGSAVVVPFDWSDGDGAPKTVQSSALTLVPNRFVANVTLNLTAGCATLHPTDAKAVLFMGASNGTSQLLLLFATLFAAVEWPWLLTLALLAGWRWRRRVRGAGASVLALLAWVSLLCLAACFPAEELGADDVGEVSFNPELRADLQPLEGTEDPLHGPMTDGVDGNGRNAGLIHEIYAVSGVRSMENLPVSHCLWTATGANPGQSEAIHLSWEAVAELNPDSDIAAGFQEGLRQLGLCTLSHPVSRYFRWHPDEAETKAPDGPDHPGGPVTLPTDPDVHNVRVTGTTVDSYQVMLTEHANEAPADDGFGFCPDEGTGFAGLTETLPTSTRREIECPTADGFLPVCAFRCRIQPAADATYELSAPGPLFAGHEMENRRMEPNLMVVNGSRTISRQMTRDSLTGTFKWQTAVTPETGEGAKRWHENFSPKILVESVSFFATATQTDGSMLRKPLRTDNNQLTIRAVFQGNVTTWTCTSNTPSPNPTLVNVSPPPASPSTTHCAINNKADMPFVTPTYNILDLQSEPSTDSLLQAPLSWEIDLAAASLPPGATGVFIRFELRTQFAGQFLRISPRLSFGPQQQGTTAQGQLRVDNPGGEPWHIRAVEIVGDDADFAAFLPSDPQPVPLPIDVRELMGGRMEVSAADFADAPLLDLVHQPLYDVDALRPAQGDGSTLEIYGTDVILQGAVPFRPGAAWIPIPAPPADVARPFSRLVYASRPLPFDLMPGESFDVLVTAHPIAAGLRQAQVKVYAHPVGLPDGTQYVAASVAVQAQSGPVLELIPAALLFPLPHAEPDQPLTRNLVISNFGQTPLQRTGIGIAGAQASSFTLVSQHQAAVTLGPAEYELYEVEYRPTCAPPYGDDHAQLEISNSTGTAVVPLTGNHWEACQP